MSSFAYVALDKSGKRAHGLVDAVDRRDAIKAVEHLGLYPVTITPSTDRPAPPVTRQGQRRVPAVAFVGILVLLLSVGGATVTMLRGIRRNASGHTALRASEASRPYNLKLSPFDVVFAPGGVFSGWIQFTPTIEGNDIRISVPGNLVRSQVAEPTTQSMDDGSGNTQTTTVSGYIETEKNDFFGLNDPRGQEVLRWLRDAAEGCDPRAINNVGVIHCLGVTVPKDEAKAMALFDRSAELGSRDGWNNLMELYKRKHHVPDGGFEAYRWFESKAKDKEVLAQRYVARVNLDGNAPADPAKREGFYTVIRKYVLPDELKRAGEWYYQAALQGYADAQYELGRLLLLVKNNEDARKWARAWLLLACRGGHARAVEALSEVGGVDEDTLALVDTADANIAKAGGATRQGRLNVAELYQRAAERGDPQAPLQLALIHANGIDVPRDPVATFAWFEVAQSLHDRKNKALYHGFSGLVDGSLDFVGVKLRMQMQPTPDQEARAQAMAAKFLPCVAR